jgi:hypothetical protein
MAEHLGAFVAISSLLIVVLGPDMALVTRNALLGGRRSGIATGLGAVLRLLQCRQPEDRRVTGAVLVAFGLIATERG